MDLCCLNRPFDDQAQDRVRLESEAILYILSCCESGDWELVGSDVLEIEMARTRDLDKLAKIRDLYSLANHRLTVNDDVVRRFDILQRQGIGLKEFDCLHLALAETYHCNVLLTTDDNFIAAAQGTAPDMPVTEPISWLLGMEAKYD